jgi:hypothetical protein
MTINNSAPMTTYFVLNKKDRSGNIQPRPFQPVFEELKRQETEEAKLRQSNLLKGGNLLNLVPLLPKDNPLMQLFTSNTSKSMPTESVDISVPTKINNDGSIASASARNSAPQNKIINEQATKASEVVSESHQVLKSFQRQTRSRTCQLL